MSRPISSSTWIASGRTEEGSEPAEAIRIVYDPEQISYEEILRFYFTMHDPTTRNRQGNDRGAQYRSAIFVLNDDQLVIAETVRAEVDASGFWKNPVVTEIDRVGKIILRIRDIPTDVEQQQRIVDINQLIGDLDKLFQSSLFPSRNITSMLDLDRSMRRLRTQRSHIKQILTNLVKNAVEAMEEGGNVTITTRNNAFLNGKAHIEIQVTDDGPGISTGIMQQLFTPVTSTKDSTHSGLGLAIVKNLMDELSGQISCTSNAGQGTRFQLYLPRVGKR